MTSCLKLRPGKIAYEKWVLPEDDVYEFLMNEYYIALGQEDAKSKFFHLFSIIEYIEHRYESYNGAKALCSGEQRKQISKKLKEFLKENGDFAPGDRERICNQVANALTKASDIGRADKLRNILGRMGIEKLKIHDREILIDRVFLQRIIDLRNKAFHGEGNEASEYVDVGAEMLYLGEKILEGIC